MNGSKLLKTDKVKVEVLNSTPEVLPLRCQHQAPHSRRTSVCAPQHLNDLTLSQVDDRRAPQN